MRDSGDRYRQDPQVLPSPGPTPPSPPGPRRGSRPGQLGHYLRPPPAATCNGTDHHGCGQVPAKITTGFGAYDIAVDQSTDTIYVANLSDTTISVINGHTCNRTDLAGCQLTPAKIAAGNYPFAIAIDPAHATAYVSNGDGTISVIRLGP